ncbi:MAG: hypothetical protein GX625_09235 [Clostridiaceae bacterium]|nr:hypothetical protein [Clostridiaceae bacterium]
MIRAGSIEEIHWKSGNWVFLDIGFSNKSSSCGLLFGDGEAYEAQFNGAVSDICNFIKNCESPVNLVVEAPLSVSFDKNGNPKGRKPERQNGKTRYWYVGLGCSVMVATTYLMREISKIHVNSEVRLFEGFVSFKSKNIASNHSNDVLALRASIKNPSIEAIVRPNELKIDTSDIISSAFKVSGMDYGVPPIIQNHG